MGSGCSKTKVTPEVSSVIQEKPTSSTCRPISLKTALWQYLNAVVMLRSCDRDVTVAQWKISQALCDSLFLQGCIPLQRIYIGSYYEGVPLEVCSDNNMLLENDAFPYVLSDPRLRPPDVSLDLTGRHYVVPETQEENPAYALLAIPSEFVTKLDILIQTSSCVYDSMPHLSSHLFKSRVSAVVFSRDIRKESDRNKDKDTYEEVHCLKSPGWPKVASEWLTRPRPEGWPPRECINQIMNAGCHVVPIGHPRCKERDLQWRWSFSLPERTLVHSLTDTQGSTLFLLKALSKHIWGGAESAGITSYSVKTVAFWTFEKHVEGAREGTITDLTLKALKMLHTFYIEWNLPHFFIPKQNLINHISQYKCRKVVRQIEEVVRNYVLNIIGCLSMGTQMPFYINNVREEIGLSINKRYKTKDQQSFLKRLHISPKSVDCLVRVVKQIQRGSHDFTTVKRIHILDAMENIKIDLLNALKQIIKCQNKGYSTPRSGSLNSSRHNTSKTATQKRSMSSTKIVLTEKEKACEQAMLIFEDVVQATNVAITSVLIGDQLKSLQMMIKRGLAESYFHLHMLTTSTRTGQKCLRNATRCLESSMTLVFSDGQESFEFDGRFNLALFYYQNCEYSKVIDILGEMNPSPTVIAFVAFVESSIYPITIDPRGTDIELTKWRGDWELFNSIKRRKDSMMVNPAAFAYYMLIQARRVLGYVLEEHEDQTSHPNINVVSNANLSRITQSETSGHLTPVSYHSQTNTADDAKLTRIMQTSNFSYGNEATIMLLKILCD